MKIDGNGEIHGTSDTWSGTAKNGYDPARVEMFVIGASNFGLLFLVAGSRPFASMN